MNITSTAIALPVARPVPRTRLAPSEKRDDYVPSPVRVESGSWSEFWRDNGINPIAMGRRAFVDRPPEEGSPLVGGQAAEPLTVEALRQDFQALIAAEPSQDDLLQGIVEIAREWGITVDVQSGVPQVNWDLGDPTVLDLRRGAGLSTNHELVHAVQCVIGGAAALGTAASRKFEAQMGRKPVNTEEIQGFLPSLTAAERAEAMTKMVKPMEKQAYSTFEKAAFHATGMMGKASKDRERYHERLGEIVDSYTEAYRNATVPQLSASVGADIYGGIGHIARTNGETALLLGGAGLAYHQLAKQAMRVHPLMIIPVSAPLAYGLYRALVSG